MYMNNECCSAVHYLYTYTYCRTTTAQHSPPPPPSLQYLIGLVHCFCVASDHSLQHFHAVSVPRDLVWLNAVEGRCRVCGGGRGGGRVNGTWLAIETKTIRFLFSCTLRWHTFSKLFSDSQNQTMVFGQKRKILIPAKKKDTNGKGVSRGAEWRKFQLHSSSK